MRRTFALLLLFALGLVFACTDGQAPLELPTGGRASVILAPSFASFSASDAQPIVKVRITARNAATGEPVPVTPDVISVDPNDSEWPLQFEVKIPGGGSIQVVFEMELLNGLGQVEFSVRTGPVPLTPGAQPRTVAIEESQIGRGPASNFDIQAVTLTPSSATVMEGETVDLTAAVQPSGTSASFFWSSLDPAVAGVASASGASARIAARLPGTARIVVTAGARADTALVTVGQKIAAVVVSPSEFAAASLGETVEFTARVVDARGEVVPGASVTWSATPEGIIKDLGGGSFKTLADGNANVSAAVVGAPQILGIAAVAVRQTVARVVVSPDGATMESIGDTVAFQAALTDARGNPVAGRSVSWTSSDPSVVSIDATSGVAVANKEGQTTITAAADDVVSTVVATVRQRARTVTVTPDSVALTSQGATQRFSAVVRDARGHAVERAVTWSSTDPSVVSIDATGLATAGASGTARVEARLDDAVGSAAVVVAQKVASAEITPAQATLTHIGATVAFSATARDASGAVVPGRSVRWSSSAAGVATIDADGVATAVGGGTTTITAVVDDVSASASLTVEQTVASIAIEPAELTFESLGLELGVSAVARDSGGVVVTGRSFTWSSSDPTVATVSPAGGVRAVGNGTATVTASADGVSGTANVVVQQVPVGMSMEPAHATLEQVGDTVRLGAAAVDSRGFGVAGLVPTWSSSDPGIASVDGSGLVTAAGSGVATITASVSGFTATATIVVGGATGAGGDLVVLNDVNIFQYSGANGLKLARNFVDFDGTGPRAAGTRVWFECGRLPIFGTTWCDYDASVREEMEAAGYTVERHSTVAGEMVSIPSDVKLIFFFMPTAQFTTAELDLLVDFVRGGGRVVYLGEHSGFAATYPPERQLFQAFGSPMDVVEDCISTDGTVNPDHQVTMEMTGITYACSAYLTGLGPNDTALASAGHRVTMTATRLPHSGTSGGGAASVSRMALPPTPSEEEQAALREAAARAAEMLRNGQDPTRGF